MKTYLVTGGAGFIGANFVKYLLKKYDDIYLVILDALTYAGNLKTIEVELKDRRVSFFKGNIGNRELVEHIFTRFDIDYVVHFAAESHVDRSIENPQVFLETNVLGTQNLLEVAKKYWSTGKDANGYPVTSFTEGVEKTIRWYLENQSWVESVVSGDYQKYYTQMYRRR